MPNRRITIRCSRCHNDFRGFGPPVAEAMFCQACRDEDYRVWRATMTHTYKSLDEWWDYYKQHNGIIGPEMVEAIMYSWQKDLGGKND